MVTTKIRKPFDFSDIKKECHIIEGCYSLNNKAVGLQIIVPDALYEQFPFNVSAYAFMQQLRAQILDYGMIEFPHLPLNKTNYTLAQKSPNEHLYSKNPYLTDYCQLPHKDTPPYPTAFWLGDKRHYFATWIVNNIGLHNIETAINTQKQKSLMQIHQQLVDESLRNGWGLLLNHQAGLLLLDNSACNQLFHARTCQFDKHKNHQMIQTETPMYAFNEMGLMHYIDSIDEQRGDGHRDIIDQQQTVDFLAKENL